MLIILNFPTLELHRKRGRNLKEIYFCYSLPYHYNIDPGAYLF